MDHSLELQLKHPAIAAFGVKVVRRIDAVKRYLALDFWKRAMLGTPVDTGQARAGWHGTVERPSLVIPERPKPGEGRLPPPPVPVFAPSLDFDRTYWVSNNVNHITFLNEGSSTKAPAGFVDDALAQTVSVYNALVQEVVATDGGF